MRKKLTLIFFTIITCCYSQKKINELDQGSDPLHLSFSTGISNPLSSFSTDAYAGNGNFFELSGAYYLSKLGIGVSIGQFSNTVEENNTNLNDNIGFPVSSNAENWKTTYYGIGPNYKTNFGNFEALAFMRAGLMTIKPIAIQADFTYENADVQGEVPVYGFNLKETTQTTYYTTGIRLGYNFSSKFNLFFTSNYLAAFSDDIVVEESIKQFVDINRDGIINEIDILGQGDIPAEFETISRKIKPQIINYGVGLNFSFGKGKDRNIEDQITKENDFSIPNNSVNSGDIVFTNPSKKERKKEERKIVLTTPNNNSSFKNIEELKNFKWQVIGEKIKNPNYFIEVQKYSDAKQIARTYVGRTSKTTINAKEVFNDSNPTDGQYSWKVTDIASGETSNTYFFTFSNCEIDFSIANEEIECLGYEQQNIKYKICFDATYSSTSGDLTFLNPGSGLTVYDQAYTSLSYTMVSPNLTLLDQTGASTTTVSYCFEVTVDPSVTAIGFGLQGDDLDPSPILCQPGVSTLFDELPDCFCDECEDIEVSFNDFDISLNGTSGNQFNFNGNINVNVPIYGIEFQVQSYDYNASPSACSSGVNSIEESGMILMPGTSINGSTSLQLFNETISGSPSTNNNATKDIKYTSTSALTGAIPVNLTIGLPGPIAGLDTSCCTMEYTVCIKVKVFYDENSCKSCVFTHCFTFNNQ